MIAGVCIFRVLRTVDYPNASKPNMENKTACTGWTCRPENPDTADGTFEFFILNNRPLQLLALNSAVQTDTFSRIVRQWLAATDSRQTQEQETLYQTQFETELKAFSRWLFGSSSQSDAIESFRGSMVSRFALLRGPTNLFARRAPDGHERDEITLLQPPDDQTAAEADDIAREKETARTLLLGNNTLFRDTVNENPFAGLVVATHPWLGHFSSLVDSDRVSATEPEDAAFKRVLGLRNDSAFVTRSIDDVNKDTRAIIDRSTVNVAIHNVGANDYFEVTVAFGDDECTFADNGGNAMEFVDAFGSGPNFADEATAGAAAAGGGATDYNTPQDYEPLFKMVIGDADPTAPPAEWLEGMKQTTILTNRNNFAHCMITLFFPILVKHFLLDGNGQKEWRTSATAGSGKGSDRAKPQADYVRKLQKLVDDVEATCKICHGWWASQIQGEPSEENVTYLVDMISVWIYMYIRAEPLIKNTLAATRVALRHGAVDRYLPVLLFAPNEFQKWSQFDYNDGVPTLDLADSLFVDKSLTALGTLGLANPEHVTMFPLLWNGLHKLNLEANTCSSGLEAGCVDEWVFPQKELRGEEATLECLHSIYTDEFLDNRPMAAAMHGRSLMETHDVHPLTSAHYESARFQAYLLEKTSETRAMKRRRVENAYADFDDEFARTQHRQENLRYPKAQRDAERREVMALAFQLMTCPPAETGWSYVPSHNSRGTYQKLVGTARLTTKKPPRYTLAPAGGGGGTAPTAVAFSEFVYQQTLHGLNELAFSAALKSVGSILNEQPAQRLLFEKAADDALAALPAPGPPRALLGARPTEIDETEFVLLPATSGGVVSGEVYIDSKKQWMCGGTFSLFSCAATLAVKTVVALARPGVISKIDF